jgi:hypothetical protein
VKEAAVAYFNLQFACNVWEKPGSIIESCISKIVTEFSTTVYQHVTVRNDRQISSALLFFILCCSRNVTTGAAVWSMSSWLEVQHTQISSVHTYMCTRHNYTLYIDSILLHVSATNPYYQADINTKIQLLPTFYGTRTFITALTTARHLSLSWVTSVQSIPPHSNSWRSILKFILPSTAGSPRRSLSLKFPHQNPVSVYFSPLPHAW